MSIDPPTDPPTSAPPGGRWLRRGLVIAAIAIALAMGGLTALTKPFQEGATRLFGKIVDIVKDHPRLTLVLCLGGVALVWLAIGAIAAGQELRARQSSVSSKESSKPSS